MQICAAASSTNNSELPSGCWSSFTQFSHVSWNDMTPPPSLKEEEELNKIHKCQGILLYVRPFLNACAHVRSVGLYEYLRHSMTSHSGCWWLTSFFPRLPANWGGVCCQRGSRLLASASVEFFSLSGFGLLVCPGDKYHEVHVDLSPSVCVAALRKPATEGRGRPKIQPRAVVSGNNGTVAFKWTLSILTLSGSIDGHFQL